MSLPINVFVAADGTADGGPGCGRLRAGAGRPGARAPRDPAVTDRRDCGTEPARPAARLAGTRPRGRGLDPAEDLTGVPAARGRGPAPGRGADAVRGRRGSRPPRRPTAAHRAGPPHALPPRPGVLPRRLDRPGRDRPSRPRCARRRRRPASTRRVSRCSASCPTLWLPPSNFAVTPVLGWWRDAVGRRAWSTPTRCTRSTGSRSPTCCDPTTGSGCGTRRAGSVPAFLIGADRDVILWGFTAGMIARLFDFLGWRGRGMTTTSATCRRTCCRVSARAGDQDAGPTRRAGAVRGEPARLAAGRSWC